MASTITAATLTVTLTEEITLNGYDQGSKNTLEIGSIKEVYKRIVRCVDDTDCTIATFQTATSTSDGAIDLENVRYIRVTNLDDTNPMNLSLQIAGGEGGTANMSSTILVKAGESFMLGTVHDGIATDDDAAGIVTSLNDLESLLVDPLSEDIDVEVFVASV
jgi:hypothetical protein|tara:strand:+ start:159 stop:644 length:486 start_codon:yes stop_codon:yes gene_type:complete